MIIEDVISDDFDIAETFCKFLENVVPNLKVQSCKLKKH